MDNNVELAMIRKLLAILVKRLAPDMLDFCACDVCKCTEAYFVDALAKKPERAGIERNLLLDAYRNRQNAWHYSGGQGPLYCEVCNARVAGVIRGVCSLCEKRR